jgi:hypothetical protein
MISCLGETRLLTFPCKCPSVPCVAHPVQCPSNPSSRPPLGRPSFSLVSPSQTPPYCKSKCQSTSESGRSEMTIHVPQRSPPLAANPAVSNSTAQSSATVHDPRILPVTYRSAPEPPLPPSSHEAALCRSASFHRIRTSIASICCPLESYPASELPIRTASSDVYALTVVSPSSRSRSPPAGKTHKSTTRLKNDTRARAECGVASRPAR